MQKLSFEEVERLAFLKYRLSGKKSMNTFIFTQAKNNKMTDKQINILLKNLDKKIKKENSQPVCFTCNIF